jgi:hypothetical protein
MPTNKGNIVGWTIHTMPTFDLAFDGLNPAKSPKNEKIPSL